jgi:hypothetical protein
VNTLARFACCSLLLSGCAGTQHISLASPGASAAGSPKICRVIPPSTNCADTTTDVPADQNQAGTAFINLPATCGGRINRIVIHDVSSKSPTAYVECALRETPIGETRATPPPTTGTTNNGR